MPITRDTLPNCLQLTQGPSPHSDDVRCPICWEDIEDDDKTITHTGTTETIGCKRRFCKGCLLKWLQSPLAFDTNERPKCPLCKARIFNANMMEDDEEDRAELVLERRRQRANPAEYHAAGSPDIISARLVRLPLDISAIDILAQVRGEMALTDDMIDIVGLEALEINVDIFTVGEICRRQAEFGLNTTSVQYLWVMSRLLGASLWYLAQGPCAPEIGFLVPRMPRFNVLSSVSRHVAERFYSPDSQEFPSTMIQPPVSADILLRNLEARNVFPVGRQATELTALREIQEAEDVTHFFLCDIERDALGPLTVGVMPWPSGSVFVGFETRAYPGWSKDDIFSSPNGWDFDFDECKLKAFATTGARMFATSTERALIRARTQVRMLRYLREQEDAQGSSASSTTGDEVRTNDQDDGDDDSDGNDNDSDVHDNDSDDNDNDPDNGSQHSSEEGSFVIINPDIQEEAVASIEVEIEEDTDDEADEDVEDVENEIDEDTIEPVDEDIQADADPADVTDTDIDVFEDDAFSIDSSSDSGTDAASEYSPSTSEGETTLEYQPYCISRREQDSLSQWQQSPFSQTEEDAPSESEADEEVGFEGFVIPDRESFESFVSLFTTPTVTAQNAGGQPNAHQPNSVGEVTLRPNTRIEPTYYYEEAGAYEYGSSGFGPEVGYASNRCGSDMDLDLVDVMDLSEVLVREDFYDPDRMDTTAG